MKELFLPALLCLSLWRRRVDSTRVLCLYCLGLSHRPLIPERWWQVRRFQKLSTGTAQNCRAGSKTGFGLCSLWVAHDSVLARTPRLPKCSAVASWNSSFLNMGIQIFIYWRLRRASLVAQLVKNLPAMWETWVQSLGWEDPLRKGKATHSSILAWRIPWTV